MANEFISYLQKLKFDPELFSTVQGNYLKNFRLTLLLIIGIIILGIFGISNLPRRLNPEVKIPIVIVSTVIPGASPKDVESLVTKPIESELNNIKGLDRINSVSRESLSLITLRFVSTINGDKAKDEAQALVDGVTGLPEEAKTPKVKLLDFEDRPIWTFALYSKLNDPASLQRFATKLKTLLEDARKVDRVVISGLADQQVQVVINSEKIRELGINPIQISQALQKGANAYPAGIVNTGSYGFSISIDPSVNNIEDIRAIKLNLSGQIISLKDIATVQWFTKPLQPQSYLASKNKSSTPIIDFAVYKISNANIDDADKAIKKVAEPFLKQYENQYGILTVQNTADEINKQFTDLVGEFRSTIILVFICLLVFLGIRQAIISSFTVPLTFLSAFFLMGIFGQSVNFISLFGFLIALGLLVDDTIVIVSASSSYYQSKKFSVQQTGLLVWRDFIIPIWSTTLTTIWSFVPLLLTTGIIGEFIKPIPLIVTFTMISSTSIAVLVTLPLMLVILHPQLPQRVKTLFKWLAALILLFGFVLLIPKNPLWVPATLIYLLIIIVSKNYRREYLNSLRSLIVKTRHIKKIIIFSKKIFNQGLLNLEWLGEKYKKIILLVLKNQATRKRVVIAIVIYSIISYLLVPFGLVKNEFFPKTDSDLIYINIETPSGTNLKIVNNIAVNILNKLKNVAGVEFLTLNVGSKYDQSGSGGVGQDTNDALITVRLVDKAKRKDSSMTIAAKLRNNLGLTKDAKVSVIEESSGPPAGSDVQIKLLGEDLGTLDRLADKTMMFLKKQPGTNNVEKSVKAGTSKIVFVPNLDKLTDMGVTIDQLGYWLRVLASGFTLDEINLDKSNSDKQEVVFRLSQNTADPESINRISIPTSSGTFPLSAFGSFKSSANPTVIFRENGERVINVSAGMLPGFSVTDANKKLINFVNTDLKLPAGYQWSTGGVNEENQKSVASIIQAMGLAFILILVTMVLQFGSFRQAAIVLMVIPLAVSSVFFIFALTNTPLSFPALIGILSLFGIVVTNSMFIVDKINLNLKEKMSFEQAIADAGGSRLEPIVLTKLCTILGLLPITIADPLWRGLGGAIISGLAISSTIMLFFIPVIYFEWFKPLLRHKP